jgi:C_GCAxxG_C_C family probable redox protein
MVDENEINKLISNIRQKTENCYSNRKMCCSESILYTFNQGLHGGLTDETAVRMGSGLCGGMGAGGGCGALNAAIMAIGMLLASGPGGRPKKKIRAATAELREKFHKQFQHEKCSDLIESQKGNRQSRLRHCQRITGVSAELAARIILQYRPELASSSDQEFLKNHDRIRSWSYRSKFGGLLKKIMHF